MVSFRFAIGLLTFLVITCTSCIAQKHAIWPNYALFDPYELYWQFAPEGSDDWKMATVPGCVHTDLMDHGKLKNPLVGDGENQSAWISESNWIYRTRPFKFKKRKAEDRVILRFEGLDTYAKVFLNDQEILFANNAFRTWEVDVKHLLKSKGNVIEVRFQSPLVMGGNLAQFYPHPLPGAPVRAVTRKPQYQYGWDWGPALPSMGITGEVSLIQASDVRITRHKIQVLEVKGEAADLEAQIEVFSDAPRTLTCQMSSDGNWSSRAFELDSGIQVIRMPYEITNPKLWWPNGMGEQTLYDISIKLSSNGFHDQYSERIGVRTITLDTLADRDGQRFMFRVNGVPFFAKGANYIPQSIFPNQVFPADYASLVHSCEISHFNMLRVWGGGIYENDTFYELCDEAGILIWQDFMFACAMYPGDEGFAENVKAEANEHIWRLESHPCMALWCGNNENSEGWHRWGWQSGMSEQEKQAVWKSYQRIFKEILPEEVADHSLLPYWESSPSLGRGDTLFSTMGDAHDWTVWHDAAPFERFEEVVPRFMSEFGFQSYPDKNTLALMVDSGVASRNHPQVQMHQKHIRGEELIDTYMYRDFGKIPGRLEDFIYLSQVQQARGIGMGIRAQRRNMPYCMGSLYWQLNDCWPAISWSSIDVTGNWKALQYEVKRAFSPRMITWERSGDEFHLYYVMDGEAGDPSKRFEVGGTITKRTLDGSNFQIFTVQSTARRNASNLIAKIPMEELDAPGYDADDWYFEVDLRTADSRDREVIFPYMISPWNAIDSEIQVYTQKKNDANWNVSLKSEKGAFWVQLETDIPGHFSENFVHVLPGEIKKLQFHPSNNAELDSLKVNTRHLGQVLLR